MKKIIRLTESDIYNLVKRVISEQSTQQDLVRDLQNDINKIIEEKQSTLFSQITLKWESGNNNENVIFSVLFNGADTGKTLVMEPKPKANNTWETKLKYIDFGNVPISHLLTTVYNNNKYIQLFNNYPNIKQQVDKAFANCFMSSVNPGGVFTIRGGFGVYSKREGRKAAYKKDEEIKFGNKLTTGNGSGANKFSVIVGNKGLFKQYIFTFEVSNSQLIFDKFNINDDSGGEPESKPINDIASITLNNQGSEPFKYDKTDLTKESIQQIDEFVVDIKEINKKYGIPTYNKYIDILKKNPINVLAYASIDGESNAIDHGTYLDCRGYGNGTRGQYNLCLSQARADKIAKILNEKLPEIGNFVGKGMGETNNFGPGWTKEKPTTNTETLPNRKFEVKLPTVTLNNPK